MLAWELGFIETLIGPKSEGLTFLMKNTFITLGPIVWTIYVYKFFTEIFS